MQPHACMHMHLDQQVKETGLSSFFLGSNYVYTTVLIWSIDHRVERYAMPCSHHMPRRAHTNEYRYVARALYSITTLAGHPIIKTTSTGYTCARSPVHKITGEIFGVPHPKAWNGNEVTKSCSSSYS